MHENTYQEAQRMTWMENVAESDAEISTKQKKQQEAYEEAAKIMEEVQKHMENDPNSILRYM